MNEAPKRPNAADAVVEAETSFRLSSCYFMGPDGLAIPGSVDVTCPNLVRGQTYTLSATVRLVYTQLPGLNPLAQRFCAVLSPSLVDSFIPPTSDVAFYLVSVGIGGSLGTDGDGNERPNDNRCP